MSEKTFINPDGVRQSAMKIRDQIEMMKTEHEKMNGRVEELKTAWTGNKANKFFAAYEEFIQIQQNFISRMEKYPDEMDQEANLREAEDI